jgi:hypothetical protein
MQNRKRLQLSRETIIKLTNGNLARAVGGDGTTGGSDPTTTIATGHTASCAVTGCHTCVSCHNTC